MKRNQTALRCMKLLTLGCALVLLMPHARAQQPAPETLLLHEKSLSGDITYVQVAEQLNNPFYKSDIISVEIVGGYFPGSTCVAHGTPDPQTVCGQYLLHPPGFRHLKELKLQVWLLKADGTAVKQKTNWAGSIGNAGEDVEHMGFIFEHVPPGEITGLVVLADGKLIARTFPPSDALRP